MLLRPSSSICGKPLLSVFVEHETRSPRDPRVAFRDAGDSRARRASQVSFERAAAAQHALRTPAHAILRRAFDFAAAARRDEPARARAAARRINAMPFRSAAGIASKRGKARHALHERRRIEHRRDLRARLHVLRGDEIQQRAAAHHHDARADRAALRFQRDLRAAEAIRAGVMPALDRASAGPSRRCRRSARRTPSVAIARAAHQMHACSARCSRPASPADSRSCSFNASKSLVQRRGALGLACHTASR